jgi:hypothetical protein
MISIVRKLLALFGLQRVGVNSQVTCPPKTITFAPPGHFYSPLPEPSEFVRDDHPVFDASLRELSGIVIDSRSQLELLSLYLPYFEQFEHLHGFSITSSQRRFNFNQDFFREADALVLYATLLHFKPRRVIEIGSGHSSALMLDVVDVSLPSTSLTFIEPYPERLLSILRDEDKKKIRIIERCVQDVGIDEFLALEADDLLFIDSSHVSKIASDVNFLFFQVLPRLKPGVIVHIHDIFWAFEYPREWILDGRSWNEAYLLRALLLGSDMYKILFWNSWAGLAAVDVLSSLSPSYLRNTGGSIYLKKMR